MFAFTSALVEPCTGTSATHPDGKVFIGGLVHLSGFFAVVDDFDEAVAFVELCAKAGLKAPSGAASAMPETSCARIIGSPLSRLLLWGSARPRTVPSLD